MDQQLVAIAAETLAAIPFGSDGGTQHADTFESISMATHGDMDVSMYDGFDMIVARRGQQTGQSMLKPRFAALLRRRSDGAVRLIRQWAQDGFMETSIMVPHERRSVIEEAFSTHDEATRAGVNVLCDRYERTDATAEDVVEHDATVLRELAWHARRAAAAAMIPDLAGALLETARDMMPTRVIQQERVEMLEEALSSIGAMDHQTHHYLDSTMRANPTECLSKYSVGRIVEETLTRSRAMGTSHAVSPGGQSIPPAEGK